MRGCGLTADTDRARDNRQRARDNRQRARDNRQRARDNRQYVRALLREKQPEFAALLESAEAELACPICQTADRGRISGLRGT